MDNKTPLLGTLESQERSNEKGQCSGIICAQQDQGADADKIVSNARANSPKKPGAGKLKERWSRRDAKIVLAFFISCVSKFVTGAVFVFFVYQDAIKKKFDYSQKDVEILASMMNIGLGLGFLPGMFFDRFGPRPTSAAGLLISTGSYLLVWSTTFTVDFYRDKSWLMGIYFLFTGFGPGFTLMVALNTNIYNFHERHAGKVVGILNAFFAGSPSVFATIYYSLFTHGHETIADNQDFRGFMLMIASMFCVVNLLNLVFVDKMPCSDADKPLEAGESTGNASQISNRSPSISNSETKHKDTRKKDSAKREQHVPLCKLLLQIDYILCLIMFSFASAVSQVFGVNITIISKAVKLDTYNKYLTLISPITNAVLSVSIGLFSDYFKLKIPRLQIITAGCVAFALCCVLVVVYPTSVISLMVAAFLCGIGIAFLYSMTPVLIKEMFNMRNFGRNWGIALLMQSVVSMPSQILFGALYDAHIKTGEGNDCYGSRCIVDGMAIFLGVSIVAILLGLIMLNLQRLKRLCHHR